MMMASKKKNQTKSTFIYNKRKRECVCVVRKIQTNGKMKMMKSVVIIVCDRISLSFFFCHAFILYIYECMLFTPICIDSTYTHPHPLISANVPYIPLVLQFFIFIFFTLLSSYMYVHISKCIYEDTDSYLQTLVT